MNHRINCVGKTYKRVLKGGLRKYVEVNIANSQKGFPKSLTTYLQGSITEKEVGVLKAYRI